MGVQERRTREKEELRVSILKAAREILLEEGHAKLSIRKVARAVEYSVGTIYLHYQSKDELLLALHQDAFQRKSMLFAPLMGITDPQARLEAMGRAYIEHAVESPADFYLMFVDDCPIQLLNERGEDWNKGQSAMDMLRLTLEQGIEKGVFRADLNLDSMPMILWSLVHGCATLIYTKRLEMADPTLTRHKVQDDLFGEMHRLLGS